MTRELREDEKNFLWEILLKGTKEISEKKGYVRFQYKGKKYKRSRILYQIYHNVFIYPGEIIHHKNKNKIDDHVTNLELKNEYEHKSEHGAGSKKKRGRKWLKKKV